MNFNILTKSIYWHNQQCRCIESWLYLQVLLFEIILNQPENVLVCAANDFIRNVNVLPEILLKECLWFVFNIPLTIDIDTLMGINWHSKLQGPIAKAFKFLWFPYALYCIRFAFNGKDRLKQNDWIVSDQSWMPIITLIWVSYITSSTVSFNLRTVSTVIYVNELYIL